MKKLLSVLLCTMILISAVMPSAVVADTPDGTCGDGLTWEIEGGVLYISGTGDMYDYTSGSATPWAAYEQDFGTVVINEGVTSVGDRAFADFVSVHTVSLPQTLLSIGDYAFNCCYASGRLTVPASVTHIGRYAFDCTDIDQRIYYEGSEEQWLSMNVVHDIYLDVSLINESISLGYCGAYKNEQSVRWRLDLNEGCFSLSGNGAAASYSLYDFNMPWRSYTNKVSSVIIGEGITAIGNNVFFGFDNLKELYLPLSITEISEGAFEGCDNAVTYYAGTKLGWHNVAHGSDRVFDKVVFLNQTPEVTVTTDGLKITLGNLKGVRDIFIAQNEYDSYREMKDNGYLFSVGKAKIGDSDSYTLTAYQPGLHTVAVRYDAGGIALLHIELTVTEPVFTVNGLQVTVSNLPDVKVIRTAYGEHSTVKQLKKAEGYRTFGASVIKGSDEYTVQYRNEGRATLTVEYNNGYVKVFSCDVAKKTPAVEQQGNSVTFGDLDGLVMIRYAMGEYTVASEIKKAEGSRVIKGASAVDGKISVTLTAGTYTFCVQYDDESYNYITVTV